MKTVKQLLDSKGGAVWSIGPDATVFDALKLMAEKEIGALVVVEGDKPVGVLSERDYARKVILKGKASKDTPVRDIMSSYILCIRPEITVQDALGLMTDKRIRHLPVLDGGKLIGVVSIGDLVKAVIAEQEFLIENLQSYIVGSPGVM